MKKKFSIKEIEDLIKKKFQENGILNMVDEDKISEIKNKIKNILDNKLKNLDEQEKEVQSTTSNSAVTTSNQTNMIPQKIDNPNITVKTKEDPEKIEIIQKQIELDNREKELIQKEIDLESKQEKLENKEKELSYKPELPEILKNIDPESIIIFTENELSLGMENLSNRRFRLKSDPDQKKSINDLWLEKAITKTNVYLVELKKIGELNFDPYQGNTTFEPGKNIEEVSQDNQNIQKDHDIQQVIKSQNPEETLKDAIDPITDVSQPILNQNDIEKQKYEDALKTTIEKILRDEMSKKNIFSL